MGPESRHWRLAKFLDRFRLFSRFSAAHKIIIDAWAKDETSLRKAGSRTDPYVIFNKRLREGNPPNGGDDLMKSAKKSSKRQLGSNAGR